MVHFTIKFYFCRELRSLRPQPTEAHHHLLWPLPMKEIEQHCQWLSQFVSRPVDLLQPQKRWWDCYYYCNPLSRHRAWQAQDTTRIYPYDDPSNYRDIVNYRWKNN